MVAFDPNSLYPLDELRTMLAGAVELPTFLDRLGLKDRRVFRDAVWGWEILEAARKAKPFSELSRGAGASVVSVMQGKGAKARGGRATAPVRRLGARDLQSPEK